jgi:phage terminase Nu1 subunit (DNA packaging protein)
MTRTLLRWTIEKAATEFCVDRKRLTRKLRQADLEPSVDGRYSTKEILSAIFDDASSERTRLYREQGDKLAIENAKARSEQIDVESVWKTYEGIFRAMRKTILASPLTDAEKAEALAQLRHDTTDAVPV